MNKIINSTLAILLLGQLGGNTLAYIGLNNITIEESFETNISLCALS
ncbi:hypothetical protein [Candidatus Tisiphia endosymbiont of Nemotelus uliginosus]